MVSVSVAPAVSVPVTVMVWEPVSRNVMVGVSPVAVLDVFVPTIRQSRVTVPVPPVDAAVNVASDVPSVNVTVDPFNGDVIETLSAVPVP